MNLNAMTNAELDTLTLLNDAGRGQATLTAVHRFLGRFVIYPNKHAHLAHTLWIVHTHLMDRWESTPRLFFGSPEPGSGKSRALEITEMLVPSPVPMINASVAYLFRRVGAEEGATILYDEIDTVFGPKAKDNEDIRGLLNAGHRRGAKVGRCVVHGKTVETEDTPVYAAVAMAGLGWLPDTILSRAVIIRMRRRRPGESVEPFRERVHRSQGRRVREMIETWASSFPTEIEWPELPVEIQDRDADVWESLIAVADVAGGDWPELARAAAVTLVTATKEREPSLGVRLLSDLRSVFREQENMATKIVLQRLKEIDDGPWRDLRGKELDERGLALRLRQYEVKPTTIRIGDATAKGYRRSDFHGAWSSYLPPSPGNGVTSVTPSQVVVPFAPQGDAVTAVTSSQGDADTCDHCNQLGATDDVYLGDLTARLHPRCINAWKEANE